MCTGLGTEHEGDSSFKVIGEGEGWQDERRRYDLHRSLGFFLRGCLLMLRWFDWEILYFPGAFPMGRLCSNGHPNCCTNLFVSSPPVRAEVPTFSRAQPL